MFWYSAFLYNLILGICLLPKFFIGENMNPDGMVALLDYREDGVTPYMIFFKDGLEMEKCVSIKKWVEISHVKMEVLQPLKNKPLNDNIGSWL